MSRTRKHLRLPGAHPPVWGPAGAGCPPAEDAPSDPPTATEFDSLARLVAWVAESHAEEGRGELLVGRTASARQFRDTLRAMLQAGGLRIRASGRLIAPDALDREGRGR